MTPQKRRTNLVPLPFLEPAIVLMAVFFLAPIVVDNRVAFADMNQTVFFTDFPTTK